MSPVYPSADGVQTAGSAAYLTLLTELCVRVVGDEVDEILQTQTQRASGSETFKTETSHLKRSLTKRARPACPEGKNNKHLQIKRFVS